MKQHTSLGGTFLSRAAKCWIFIQYHKQPHLVNLALPFLQTKDLIASLKVRAEARWQNRRNTQAESGTSIFTKEKMFCSGSVFQPKQAGKK